MLHRYLKAALFTRTPGDWLRCLRGACPATAPPSVRLVAGEYRRLQLKSS
jgi:hypothetical protein